VPAFAVVAAAAAILAGLAWNTAPLPEPRALRSSFEPFRQAGDFDPVPGQPGKDVVWVPSAEPMVDVMLDIAGVTAEDVVIDLGSGDGRTVIAAAKRGARARGLEFNPDLVTLSTANARAEGVEARARFVQGDIFESDLSDATVITMFLLPELNRRLRPQLLELKPGTRLVSNTFTMDEWMPDAVASAGGGCRTWCVALMWIVPAKVSGVWRLGRDTLTLTQSFQMLSGTLRTATGVVPIEHGRMQGAAIEFVADGIRYTGEMNGHHGAGQAAFPDGPNPWTATRVRQEP
jgi:methylase of polypeptide subunit release factors